MEHGNLSNVKSVGEGALEYRIDFGPGYRVYFGRDGERLVILLTGGTKKRQQRDIGNGDCLLAGLQAPQADVPLNGVQQWQEQRSSRSWSNATSRMTRNLRRRFCVKESMRCSPGTSRPERRSSATTSRRPSALKSSAPRPARRLKA